MNNLNLFAIIFLGLQTSTLYAQKTKTYKTFEINSTITVDGNIDEPAWNQVEWAGEFTQTDPHNGADPSFETQFKILFDKDNLYVAIRAFDNPDSIVIEHKPRDYFAGDYVEINIDSDLDKIDAFSFTVTAAGIRGDEYIRHSDNWENDWNPQWTTKTKIDAEGWVAEIRIPLTELEIYDKKQNWGIQVNRSIERLDEGSSWSEVPDEDKWVESFGVLKGIESIQATKQLAEQDDLSPLSMKEDFSLLYESLLKTYPSLYRYHNSDFIKYQYEKRLDELATEKTIVNFYKTVAAFTATLGDGHMKVLLPEHISSHYAQTKRLPFSVDMTADELIIQQSFSNNESLKGARIVSIAGRSTQELITELSEIVASDGYNTTGKYHRISAQFDVYLALLIGRKENVTIEYVPKNEFEVQAARIALVTLKEYREEMSKLNKRKKVFDFEVQGDIGIIRLHTFNYIQAFRKFVDESFQKLSDENINKLIIDLRGNGGGEETNAIHLYSYLAEKPFKYYDRYEIAPLPNKEIDQSYTRVSYETLNFLSTAASPSSGNNRIITDYEPFGDGFIDPSKYQVVSSKNKFGGKVAILIDGGSFSATSEFCSIVKRDKRAFFIGTETGGASDGNTSGIYDHITLPNSRLKIRIPLIKYVSAVKNSGQPFGRGVMPDYQMDNPLQTDKDEMMDFAVDYLSAEN